MIKGLDYSDDTIAKEQNKYITKLYQDGRPPVLVDGIRYYGTLFTAFLYAHADHTFTAMNEDEQTKIIQKEYTLFRTAMMYSFNKGHQMGFLLLLRNDHMIDKHKKPTLTYDQSFFTNPSSHDYFVYTLQAHMAKNIIKLNLQRDAINMLIRHTRQHFEAGYDEISELAIYFYKKGAGVAFEQIRTGILNIDYKITGRSRLLNIPYNQSVTVTPAFKATFSIESLAYEELDLHWDETYGQENASRLIAKLMVHQFSYQEIQKYAQVHAPTYVMIKNFLNADYNSDTPIYLAKIDFLTTPPLKPRLINSAEYQSIREAINQTLLRRLKVKQKQLLVAE